MLFSTGTPVGLDIGARFIKVAQVKEKKSGYELELFDMIPLAPEVIVDGAIMDSIQLTDTVRELLRKARVKTKDSVISVTGHSAVIIKIVSLPLMTKEELDESIKFEAEQYIPFDINDVNIDFQILGPKEEPGQMDVVLVAVKNEVINEYVTVITEAGLNPIIVDVDVFALENIYEINYEILQGRNVALLDIGASSLKLNIVNGALPSFTRNSPIGNNIQTEALQRHFNIPFESAERLKRGDTIEDISEEDALAVIAEASEEIFREINRSFDYYRSSMAGEEVSEIILSGGGALIKGFPDILSEKTGIAVRIFDPFQNISISHRLNDAYIRNIAPMASVAVGLALRRVGDR